MSNSKNNVDRMIESMSEREVEQTIEILENSKNLTYTHIEQLAEEWAANKEEEENSKGKSWWR